ncbi:MAG: aldo/keto reductase [Clostridium sp.]|uniref:aldo/keto reductase n=1 Tax=Clostridium sp. TaxID=1506 RepID=UPI003D6C9468
MDKIKLGRTNLMVTRSGFGALPVQRVSFEDAKTILRKAYDNGINFFDTARAYSDSEEKLGYSLSDVRKDIIIATKSHATDRKTLLDHLQVSLKNLKTDYVDILQLHNPGVLPDPNDAEGLYAGLLEAKRKGLVRFIGITNHKLKNAMDAATSELYDTVQFPLCSLSTESDLLLIEECKKRNIGLIAMKALSGGLITNAASAFSFLRQYDNVVPIWGIQRESELDEFIYFEKNPPLLDDAMWSIINKDRIELSGDFCRGCGYCLPCPVGIQIPTAARITLLLKRAPYQGFLEDSFKEKMDLINNCIECGHCKNHCPYNLDTPNLLKRELKNYTEFYNKHKMLNK